jgi:hypothetical protein
MSLNVVSIPKNFSNDVLLSLVKKINQKYVLPLLNDYTTITTRYGLWMSKGAHDIFALVVNILRVDSQPKHVPIELFEVNETIGQALAKNLIKLLDTYDLRKKN